MFQSRHQHIVAIAVIESLTGGGADLNHYINSLIDRSPLTCQFALTPHPVCTLPRLRLALRLRLDHVAVVIRIRWEPPDLVDDLLCADARLIHRHLHRRATIRAIEHQFQRFYALVECICPTMAVGPDAIFSDFAHHLVGELRAPFIEERGKVILDVEALKAIDKTGMRAAYWAPHLPPCPVEGRVCAGCGAEEAVDSDLTSGG
jgi:hypothetical protein